MQILSPPHTYWIRNSGVGASNPCYNKSSRWFWCVLKSENHCLGCSHPAVGNWLQLTHTLKSSHIRTWICMAVTEGHKFIKALQALHLLSVDLIRPTLFCILGGFLSCSVFNHSQTIYKKAGWGWACPYELRCRIQGYWPQQYCLLTSDH